jgi:CRISPR-associated protein Cmr6
MSNYYLPQETAQLLTSERLRRCKNLGLLLDKYPPRTAIDTEKKSDGKSNWLKEFARDNHIDPRLAEQVYQRWKRAITTMEAQQFTAMTEWRMVVGLGGETVLETDLTLHHLYGIPIIPGSALKGLTRAYVTGEVHPSKRIEDDNAEVQRIFGTQKDAGTVIFFDAMPVDGKIEIDLDIMNAHYHKYYGEKQPPTNTENPIPITFLTVTNTAFLFALAPRRPKDTKGAEDVALAMGWLQSALQKYGVGGKTSAGYGYFKDIDSSGSPFTSDLAAQEQTNNPGNNKNVSQSLPVDSEVRKAEGYIRELEAVKDVAGQIHGYYQKWQQITSPEARKLLANAIVEKVRKAGREKKVAEKAWYKELLTFLGEL